MVYSLVQFVFVIQPKGFLFWEECGGIGNRQVWKESVDKMPGIGGARGRSHMSLDHARGCQEVLKILAWILLIFLHFF